ncbi:amino-acid N-acetyltransferase [Agromyces seonyuensis]|uniref:Amino-acid N-acetyltransferase n=1 Tax=Agromyces seonyuensis TaxID=2662446 RepID=A0A6I4P481_9MICO|nr:amino-acid N-acetyltransferase [Agromyces seonyuensis]
MSQVTVRRARTSDVPRFGEIIGPLVERRILLGKEWVELYGAVPEFRVAEVDGVVAGFGAVHVMWKDLGEVRTLAVDDAYLGTGVGHALLDRLETDARELGLTRLFCLTFETAFFGRHGFVDMGAETVDPEVYMELVRSNDEGIAEFLDLARVKQNTLGNTRMIKHL